MSTFEPHERSEMHKPDIVRHSGQSRTGDALPCEVRLEKVRHVGKEVVAQVRGRSGERRWGRRR